MKTANARITLICVAQLLIWGGGSAPGLAAPVQNNPSKNYVAVLPKPAPLPPVALTNHHGETFTLSEFKGRNLLVFFGYTHCPDACPATLTLIRAAFQRHPELLANSQLIMISLDPWRDTPSTLNDFITYFNPAFIAATGTTEALQKLVTAMGGRVEYIDAATGKPLSSADIKTTRDYYLNHTPGIYVINPFGELYGYIVPSTDTDQFADGLATLFAKMPQSKALTQQTD